MGHGFAFFNPMGNPVNLHGHILKSLGEHTAQTGKKAELRMAKDRGHKKSALGEAINHEGGRNSKGCMGGRDWDYLAPSVHEVYLGTRIFHREKTNQTKRNRKEIGKGVLRVIRRGESRSNIILKKESRR